MTLKNKITGATAATFMAAATLINTPEPAEAHHGAYWVTADVCTDNGVDLYNCFRQSVLSSYHPTLNCASQGGLPVLARGNGNNLFYKFCSFNW